MYYLDDFVGIVATQGEAIRVYQEFLDLTTRLELEPSLPKCVPPITNMEWLSFHICSISMRMEIPESQLAEVLTECTRWEAARRGSRKDLQRLVRKMQHSQMDVACEVTHGPDPYCPLDSPLHSQAQNVL